MVSDNNPAIRIVIVDDHKLIRQLLKLLFAGETRFKIVGEAGDAHQAIKVLDHLQPDIVLLDISIPGLSGLELLPTIKEKCPDTKVLMLTGKQDEDTIITALKSGAKGYLSKNSTCDNLIKSIKLIHDGDLWIERRLVNRIFEEQNRGTPDAIIDKRKNIKKLTPREYDVLCCLAKGRSNKDISRTLSISEKTVKSHLTSIFLKLNVRQRLEAIVYALKAGVS
jgi:two-component system nitrate/nitrite response regulator NarL